MTVQEFLAAEEARDVLRQRRRRDRQAFTEALEMARKNPENDGACRLIEWACDRYGED